MNGEIRCPKCKGDKFSYAGENTFKCAYCGTVFQLPKPEPAPQPVAPQPQQENPIVVNVQMPQDQGRQQPDYRIGDKSKTTAGLLAIFLGCIGVHWFYLGRTGKGCAYLLIDLLLCWTFVVPCILYIVCLVDAIRFFCMGEEEFDDEYNS